MAAALAVLAALLPGCGRNRDAPPALPVPRLDLQTTFTATGNRLTIDYVAVNHDSVAQVLFIGVPAADTTSTPEVDPNAVYVAPGDGDIVVLSKRVYPVPPGVDPAAQFLIRGVVLSPGERHTEQVVVALPLKPRVPYRSAMARPPGLPSTVRRVRFCLGAAREDQVHALPAGSDDADPRPVYPHSAVVDRAQQVYCAAEFHLPSSRVGGVADQADRMAG